ncbi:hypothetical protein L593_10440 [Salinarchaeum sp. Harcht-Bsk1]|uniref:DUF7311 family protein n=1 Tax=Salinarchaeum sp. Harcht-Bsk1 TaxID=1333523 RepID=UPI0003424085|nr:hypothetical protein [Salinarchaeum sp. Harcht-Bsk1]AGN02033.1 hypothetical protein L593_10440 [Salinarchaeum sp. Harcht-Bsk1]
MIRVVVTVLLAIALLAAALPAVEDAAADRIERQLRADIEAIDTAATELLRSEEAVPGTAGARRTVSVTLAADGIAAAPVEEVRISSTDRRYSFRVEGRGERKLRGTVPVHTLGDEPLVLREPGTHELVLALVRVEGERRVVIARIEAVRDGALGGTRASATGPPGVQD